MNHIHFIGAGQMTEAILRAALKNGVISPDAVSLSDIDPGRIDTLNQRYQLSCTLSQSEALSVADYIVIGVRPQDDIAGVTQLINQYAAASATVISIIAGVTLAQLAQMLGEQRATVRVIPNTLTDTGLGYSGVTFNPCAQRAPLEPFLTSFGKVMELEERLMDTFTGFAVAGVNYVYYFIEALVDAGVLVGLTRTQATKVVNENLVGAVEMLNVSGCHPRQLMDINNSPAGVGINGLYELNKSNFIAGLQSSVLAAVQRTTALSGQ